MANVKDLKTRLIVTEDTVSRVALKFKEAAGIPLADIAIPVLNKRLTTLEETVAKHQKLCEELRYLDEDVSESEDTVEADSAAATVDLTHLINRGTAHVFIRTIERMLQAMESGLKEEGFSSKLDREFGELSSALASMHILLAQPGASDCSELEDLATEVIRRQRLLQSEQKTETSEPDVKVAPSTVSIHNTQGLPLVIPQFDGNLLSWRRWWNTFSSIMKENAHLTKYSQRCHLLTAMGTEEAKEFALKTFELHETHDAAIAAIREKYEDQRTLHKHHHQTYFVQGAVTADRKSLDKFSDLFQATHKAFVDCQVTTAGQIMIMHATLQFSPHLLNQWKKYNRKKKSTPMYQVMVDFLKDQIECLGEEELTPGAITTSKKGSYRPSATTTFQTRPEGQTMVCSLCEGTHFVAFCPQYLEKSLEDRNEYVRSSRLCFNCLGSSHRSNECRNPKRCKTCKKRHHTTIHQNRSEETSDDIPYLEAQSNRVEPHSGKIPPRLIKTAMARIKAESVMQNARIQFDSGSTISLITAKLARALRAPKIPNSAAKLSGINGSRQPVLSSGRVRVTLMGLKGEEMEICPQVIEEIAPTPCRLDLRKIRALSFLKDKTLSDPRYVSLARIDLLMDVESSNACHTEGVLSGPHPGLKAYETIFGWTLSGGDTLQFQEEEATVRRVSTLEDPIQVFRDLLVLEEEADDEFTRDELRALQHCSQHIQRDSSGRYYVSYPPRQPKVVLGRSRGTALHRLLNTEKSLVAAGEWEMFSTAVEDYFSSGHSEEVPVADARKSPEETYYLPMHGVKKESSSSTKFRVVFDASAKSSTGHSLNDTLLPGPALHPLLPSVLTSFRSFPIVFSADISRMFREIGVNASEYDYQRYLQRGVDGVIRELRHNRLVFGITSSPFLANQVVRQVALDYEEKYPLAAGLVKSNYYVDDCLAGAQTVKEAHEIVTQSIEMMKEACLHLRKWRSNSEELLDLIAPELRETSDLELPSSPSDCSKALGIHWDPRQDVLYVAVPTIPVFLVATRREVARAIARIYDVLGFYSPYILLARAILQATWELPLQWDEELPEKLQRSWVEWLEGLAHIAEHPISRYLGELGKKVYSIQLHGFADASLTAYGGVVYVRYFHQDATIAVGFVSSRMRIVPRKKRPTIPRLELCAALTLSQLMARVQKELKIPAESTYYWSDSQVVIGWLQHPPGELQTFVANRVEKIQTLTRVEHWRYVKGDSNPADLLSRGVPAQDLVQSRLWWKGPPWLSSTPEDWPFADPEVGEELPEIKAVVHVVTPSVEFGKECSSFDELVRSVAWMRRFFHRVENRPDFITVLEYLEARTWLLRYSQEYAYPEEYRRLADKQLLPKDNPLASLNPFLDDQGVMRVGGRLQKAGLHPAVAHPVILNIKSRIVKLFVTHLHQLLHHAGSSTVMSVLAVYHHVPTVKRFLRALGQSCVRCRIFYAQSGKQQMGELPEARVRVSRPFSTVGIDFAGPFKIKRGRIRDPTKLKAYICLFICYATKAIHLELVSEMTTDAFLAALTRFAGRRGAPECIETDNGSNFIGADLELKEVREALLQAPDWDRVERWSAAKSILWKFTPVHSPQSGGFWEAAVGSMKGVLKKYLSPHLLDFEEFNTVLVEVEAILNSRPLIAPDSPADDAIEPLTPGHFLIGAPLMAVPFRHEQHTPIHLVRRWNLVKKLQHDLWERWLHEYILKLQQRKKDKREAPSLHVGDVVLEKNLGTYQRVWPLAVVVKVRPGTDNLVRTVDVRRPNGKIVCRNIRYLARLFSESAGPDSDGGECSGRMPLDADDDDATQE